jgi:hypothetical protein
MKRTSSPFQPDSAGRHTEIAVHPGMVISHNSHGEGADAPARGGDLARNSTRGKIVRPVPVAAGMHRVTGTDKGAPTITTLDRIPDASSPCATDATTGKSFAPVAVSPGMNAGKHAKAVGVGQAILDAAFANSAKDDRSAHGRGGPAVRIGK